MGNHLKTSKSSLYSLENDKSFLQKATKQEPEIPATDYRRFITSKVERQVEIRLAVALKSFPERWKCFCFGSILNMKGRYRNIELPVGELRSMIDLMTKNVKALHVRPVGEINCEAITIRDLTDEDLLWYGAKVAKHLSGIRQFTISGLFDYQQGISYNGLQVFMQKIARNLSGLQKLTLNLSYANDAEIEVMAAELTKGLANLQSIEIIINNNSSRATNKGLGALLSGLNRYSTRLKHLDLSFQDYLDDEKISVIGENLHRNLRNLKGFVLKAQSTNASLTNKGLEILGSKMGKYLMNLEHLDLSFFYQLGISDKGADLLLSKICTTLRNLKSLSLSFAGCKGVPPSTFIKIFTTVNENQKNLISLSINFKDASNGKIDKSTFKSLRSKKICLNNLRHLKLNLMRCNSLNNEALFVLRDWIKEKLPNLKSFFLNVLECNQPSREGMITLKKDLGFIPNLDISVRLNII